MTFTTKIIFEAVSEHGTPDDFLGIDGDRFVVITHADNADKLADTVTEQFQQGARAFYTFSDAQQGGILVNEGTDKEQLAPLMELHIKNTRTEV